MFLKRTLLACSLALIFPALPSYAEVGTESGNTAQAEKPGLWRRFTDNVAETGTTRLTTISISRPLPGTTVGLMMMNISISTTNARGAPVTASPATTATVTGTASTSWRSRTPSTSGSRSAATPTRRSGARWMTRISAWGWALPPASPRVTTGNTFPSRRRCRWPLSAISG